MQVIETQTNRLIKYETIHFSGGELHIQLENPEVEIKSVEILASIRNSDDLMELVLLCSAIQGCQHAIFFADISVTLPYLPYARQDRYCAKGQAFSIQSFAKILGTLNLRKLTTWDCHSEAALDTLKHNMKYTEVVDIPPYKIIKSSSKLRSLLNDDNTVLISPDKGALRRSTDILKNLCKNQDMIICSKVRDPATGKITNITVDSGDLTGITCVIADDIGDGLGTFLGIAQKLKDKNAEKVVLVLTHGIFSKGIDVCVGLIDEVYCTNSIPLKEKSIIVPVHVIEYNSESTD